MALLLAPPTSSQTLAQLGRLHGFISLHESCSEDDVDGTTTLAPNVASNNCIVLVRERLAGDANTPKGGSRMKQQQCQQRQQSRHGGSFQVPVERLSMLVDSNRSVSLLIALFVCVPCHNSTFCAVCTSIRRGHRHGPFVGFQRRLRWRI